jgi:hypothetical protein
MKRCLHKNARILTRMPGWVNAYCDDCEQGWRGNPHGWVSFSGRQRKAPKWVHRLVTRISTER